jgi:hypothetical protein
MHIKRKHVLFEPEKKNPRKKTLNHLSHRFANGSKPAAQKSFGCRLSHFRMSVSTSSSSAKHLPRVSTELGTALYDKHLPPQTGNVSL